MFAIYTQTLPPLFQVAVPRGIPATRAPILPRIGGAPPPAGGIPPQLAGPREGPLQGTTPIGIPATRQPVPLKPFPARSPTPPYVAPLPPSPPPPFLTNPTDAQQLAQIEASGRRLIGVRVGGFLYTTPEAPGSSHRALLERVGSSREVDHNRLMIARGAAGLERIEVKVAGFPPGQAAAGTPATTSPASPTSPTQTGGPSVPPGEEKAGGPGFGRGVREGALTAILFTNPPDSVTKGAVGIGVAGAAGSIVTLSPLVLNPVGALVGASIYTGKVIVASFNKEYEFQRGLGVPSEYVAEVISRRQDDPAISLTGTPLDPRFDRQEPERVTSTSQPVDGI